MATATTPTSTESTPNVLHNRIAELERQLAKSAADNDKLRRDLGNSRAQAKQYRAIAGSLEKLLKEGGPAIAANEAGEVIVTLKETAMVGLDVQPAHTVIARIVPCAGATMPYIVDAIRSGLARARPAREAEPVKAEPVKAEPEARD